MFDSLSEKLQNAFRNFSGKGKLSEDNIQDALKEIRTALLEADVNFKVVKKFVNEIKEEALGKEVIQGLDPGQQLVKVVHDKLIEILGGTTIDLQLKGSSPAVIMMVGLQGSGKTTSCGKLARLLSEQGKSPMLVPCDIYRPAAILQLKTVGQQVNVPVYDTQEGQKPLEIVTNAVKQAKNTGRDVVIIDTAGRLHIDEALMDELKELKTFLNPNEILFVADAMTGQDAVNSARAFHETLEVSGIVLTKMDGDARGGAALSIKSVTERPIKFIGTGEKLDAFEKFHPDRIAGRILGMGDVLSLIEKVQGQIDQEEAQRLQEKMLANQFTLEDFARSLKQINRMGDMGSLMSLIPGMSKVKDRIDSQMEVKEMSSMLAIINSMTLQERQNHSLINQKRKTRIARGSGTSIEKVNTLLFQFMQMRKMMSMMTKPNKVGKLTQIFSQAGLGDFAKSVIPGIRKGSVPMDMDDEKVKALIEQQGGKVTPELRKQLGLATPKQSQAAAPSRPKKDRKKQKENRKKGRRK